LVALGSRYALNPLLGPHAPYLPFVLAIIATAWFARGPALIAVVISALAVAYVFIAPYYSFAIGDPAAGAGLVLFVVVGVIVALLVGKLRESLIASAQAAEVLRRQAQLVDLSHDAVIIANAMAGLQNPSAHFLQRRDQWNAHPAGPDAVLAVKAMFASIRSKRNHRASEVSSSPDAARLIQLPVHRMRRAHSARCPPRTEVIPFLILPRFRCRLRPRTSQTEGRPCSKMLPYTSDSAMNMWTQPVSCRFRSGSLAMAGGL
jgi:K+-sensing histidine kinase KdpD